jgi:long-chain acyl-CoA synthetase
MRSVLETLARRADCYPDDIAVTDGVDTLTYRALWREVEALTAKLAVLYAGPGAVALCLDNSPAWVVMDLALTRLGRPTVPIPPFFTEAQRRYSLVKTGAKTLITDRPVSGFACTGKLAVLGRELLLHDEKRPLIALPPQTAKITFTSGSTGQPKGVCLSQAGLERVATSLVDVIGIDYAGTHCAVLPLAVLLENVAGLYPTLLAGGRYHVPALADLGMGNPFAPDFATLVGALADCGATSTIMVPEILRGAMAALSMSGRSLPAMKLVAVGGAKVSPGLLAEADALRLPVFEGYGLSEMGSVVSLNTPRDNRSGSIGRPLPHVALTLAPDGEILIANPLFLGYVGEPPPPEVLATGDVGRFDEGYLSIEGRKSNLLITAFGRNVAPEWPESELLAQPQVGQALVFGEAAPALGALIVPASASVPDVEIAAAVDRANSGLPDYAKINHWSKVPPFTPAKDQLTGNGRLRRKNIHDDHRALMTHTLRQHGQYRGFFEELVTATEAERRHLQATPQIIDGLAGRISRETYLHYLTEAFHHVRHTVSLMKVADQRMPADRRWLRDALEQYIADETGHEEWILDDIHNAGGDPNAVRNGKPRLATELMVAYAYDYVGRVNPVGFFGMVFVLEGTSSQLASRGARALMETLQLPETCFRYLLSHGAVDIDHMQFFQGLMNAITDAGDRTAIIHMAKTMFILFADVFRSIPHVREDAHAV